LIRVETSLAGIALAVLSGAIWIGLLSARGAYLPHIMVSRGRQIRRVVPAAVAAWALTHLSATWLKVSIPFESRLVVALSLPATLVCLVFLRQVLVRNAARAVHRRLARGSILVLGDSPHAKRLAGAAHRRGPGARSVIRYLASDPSPERAASLVREHGCGEVILDPARRTVTEAMDLAFACVDSGAEARILSAENRIVVRRPENGGIGGLPLMRLRRLELAGPERVLKRVVDIVGSAVGMVVLAPVFVAIGIAVRLSSPGPIIYRQDRIGRQGRRFRMYKFRTMRDGNDSAEYQRYQASFILEGKPARVGSDGEMIFKPPEDPRVTRVGAWLRKTSLDELPQLYNVLRGEMSLVGPRPCMPFEWELYEAWQRRRLDVTPGCTGLWQVMGRSRVRFEDMAILDLYYAHHGTLLTDLRLIVQTIPVMVHGRGGY
jgi:exopolysaccharide biosynthesis polyprenyl glycosylphosphotransferase